MVKQSLTVTIQKKPAVQIGHLTLQDFTSHQPKADTLPGCDDWLFLIRPTADSQPHGLSAASDYTDLTTSLHCMYVRQRLICTFVNFCVPLAFLCVDLDPLIAKHYTC